MKKYLPKYFFSIIDMHPKKLVCIFFVLFTVSFLSAANNSKQYSDNFNPSDQGREVEVETASEILYISEEAQVVGLDNIYVTPANSVKKSDKNVSKKINVTNSNRKKTKLSSPIVERSKKINVNYVIKNSGETSFFKVSNSVLKAADRVQRGDAINRPVVYFTIFSEISTSIKYDYQERYLLNKPYRTYRVRPPPQFLVI